MNIYLYIYIIIYIYAPPPGSKIYRFRVLESQMQQAGSIVHLFNIRAGEDAEGGTRVILTFSTEAQGSKQD